MPSLQDLVSLDSLDDPVPFLNHKSSIYCVVIASIVLTSICVCMRMYVRFFVTRAPGIDDYCLILTWIVMFASNVGCCILVGDGLGQHFLLLGLDGMSRFTQTFWWSLALYNSALALVKLSLLIQFLRVTDERPDITQPKLRTAILVMIGIVSLWGVAESLIAWIPANPISATWDYTGAPASRWGYASRDVDVFRWTFYQHSASNTVLDIIVLALPISSKSLWATVNSERNSRRGLIGLFILGSGTITCSIVRFAAQIATKAGTWPSFDPTFYGASTSVLSIIEVDLATVAATLPVFWPHLRREIAAILVTREVEVKITRHSALWKTRGGESGLGDIERASAMRLADNNDDDNDDLYAGGGDAHHHRSAVTTRDGPKGGGAGDDAWVLPKPALLRGDLVMLTEYNVEAKGQAAAEEDERLRLGRKPSRTFSARSGGWINRTRTRSPAESSRRSDMELI